MASKKDSSFITASGFCPDCGSVLPLLSDKGGAVCYACEKEWGLEVFGNMQIALAFNFKSKYTYESAKKIDNDKDNADGPVVERRCPQCQNDKMSFATLQLRSADEGQTVFYTCTKCKYKETENS